MYNVKDTIAFLERAVAEKGADYVYPAEDKEYRLPKDLAGAGMCRYFTKTDKLPACIVGHVLHYTQLEDKAKEGTGAHALDIELEFDYDARRVLEIVQTIQDNGGSWGDALESVRGAYSVEREEK